MKQEIVTGTGAGAPRQAWKSKMKGNLNHLQFVAAAALLVGVSSLNVWGYKDEPPPVTDELSANGDSVGTLPIVIADTFDPDAYMMELAHNRVGLGMTLQRSQLQNVIQGAWGTGYVELQELAPDHPGNRLGDKIHLKFIGEVHVALNEADLQSGRVSLDLAADSMHDWYYALQMNHWQSSVVKVGSGQDVSVDLMRAFNMLSGAPVAKAGHARGSYSSKSYRASSVVNSMTVLTAVYPGIRSRIDIQRISGLIYFSQQ